MEQGISLRELIEYYFAEMGYSRYYHHSHAGKWNTQFL